MMKNENVKVDTLLKSALKNTEAPDPELVREVKYQLNKEESILKKTTLKRSFKTVATAVMAFLLITTTAFAAWQALSPSDVADKLEYPILAEAFNSDDALLINETKSDNGYDVSFLGIVSGKGLIELSHDLDKSKSYAVVAIAKQEGPMPDTSSDDYDRVPFFISPLIKGQQPWHYNIASMGGGYRAFVVDGIMYRLVECDSLEIFADRGLVLIVSSTTFYDINAYNYDEVTGLVTPNPAYDGVNLMFELPLDPAKADFDKAQHYLDTLWDDDGTNDARNIHNNAPREFASSQIQEDSEKGMGISQVMTYEEYQAWMEQKLAETQALVDQGKYSAASMELDRRDYESNLADIKNGATLTMLEYEDGSYRLSITYPETGFSATLNPDGGIVIHD